MTPVRQGQITLPLPVLLWCRRTQQRRPNQGRKRRPYQGPRVLQRLPEHRLLERHQRQHRQRQYRCQDQRQQAWAKLEPTFLSKSLKTTTWTPGSFLQPNPPSRSPVLLSRILPEPRPLLLQHPRHRRCRRRRRRCQVLVRAPLKASQEETVPLRVGRLPPTAGMGSPQSPPQRHLQRHRQRSARRLRL